MSFEERMKQKKAAALENKSKKTVQKPADEDTEMDIGADIGADIGGNRHPSRRKKIPKSDFDLDDLTGLEKAALKFALAKCINLFKSTKFDVVSSPVAAFKSTWVKLLAEIIAKNE